MILKSDATLEIVTKLAVLLEESIDPGEFSVAMLQLEENPALMGSLMAVQFVRDAVQGNSTPDLRYTQAIVQFIAEAEARRKTAEKDDR